MIQLDTDYRNSPSMMILESLSFTIISIMVLHAGSSSLPPPVDLAGYFPYLPKDGSMSEEEHEQHLSTLYQESEKIRTRFALLMRNLQKDLERNSKLEGAINLLTFYDRDLKDDLSDCTSFGSLFREVTGFVSFFDYKLLKILAKYLGSSEIKKKFKKIQISFSRVCQTSHL